MLGQNIESYVQFGLMTHDAFKTNHENPNVEDVYDLAAPVRPSFFAALGETVLTDTKAEPNRKPGPTL